MNEDDKSVKSVQSATWSQKQKRYRDLRQAQADGTPLQERVSPLLISISLP